MLVSVEGNIGSGKTYFLDILKENSPFLIVDEPWLQVQDLLVNFYTDPYSWAFPLQLAMLTKRAHNHMRIQNSSDNIVVERTIQSDRFIFAENNRLRGYMSEKRFLDYLDIYTDIEAFVKKPDLYIYLRASVKTLTERIIKRDRNGEYNICAEYIQSINKLYDDWLLNKENCEIVDVNSDWSHLKIVSTFNRIIEKYGVCNRRQYKTV